MRGTIHTVMLGRSFGYITAENGKNYFFHSDDLEGLDFNEQLRERRVEFVDTSELKGPRAKSVRGVN